MKTTIIIGLVFCLFLASCTLDVCNPSPCDSQEVCKKIITPPNSPTGKESAVCVSSQSTCLYDKECNAHETCSYANSNEASMKILSCIPIPTCTTNADCKTGGNCWDGYCVTTD